MIAWLRGTVRALSRGAAFCALLLCGCAPMAPSNAPAADMVRMVLVAQLRPGGEYPAAPECARGNVVCLDANPYWLKAHVLFQLSGPIAPADFSLDGHDHFGVHYFKDFLGPTLVEVRTDGQRYYMQKYRRAALVRSKSGELFLIRRDTQPPAFLPCSVDDVREELREGDFDDERMVIDREDFASAGVDQHPERYRLTATGAMPRYGIRMRRLAEFMAQARRRGLPLACETD